MVIGLLAASCGSGSAEPALSTIEAPSNSAPAGSTASATTVSEANASSTAVPPSVAQLDLDGVVPASIPMVISEHLSSVVNAVQAVVGDDVFAGAQFVDAETDEPRIEIYATDPSLIESALDAIHPDARDRIDVMPAEYSANELQDFVERAEESLAAADIKVVWLFARFDTGQIEVGLVTPDGQSDPDLESRAQAALAGLPVAIGVTADTITG